MLTCSIQSYSNPSMVQQKCSVIPRLNGRKANNVCFQGQESLEDRKMKTKLGLMIAGLVTGGAGAATYYLGNKNKISPWIPISLLAAGCVLSVLSMTIGLENIKSKSNKKS